MQQAHQVCVYTFCLAMDVEADALAGTDGPDIAVSCELHLSLPLEPSTNDHELQKDEAPASGFSPRSSRRF